MPGLVEAAHDLRELIEEHADDAAAERRLPAATVQALTDAGLMRMCVPVEYGGQAADPVTLIDAIEAVSIADGAAGWCAMIASTTSSLAAFLPAPAATEIYGDATVVTGGVFAPNGVGRRTERDGADGYVVDGRWAWGSGTQHCQWILGGTMCDDQTFRLCWFPSAEVTFHDTWHTGGMRGSGSLDYSVQEAFAPTEFTMRPGVTPPVIDSALARFPNFALLAAGVSAVGLGVGRRALDELHSIAQAKSPQFSTKTLAHNGFAQIEFARAEAALRSARAFLRDELACAWATVSAGDDVTITQRATIRLAATNAAAAGVIAADTAYTLAGGSAVYDSSPFGRRLRDAHVVTQHIQTAPKLNEKIGRVLFGLDVDISTF